MTRLGAIYRVTVPPSANNLHASRIVTLQSGQPGPRRFKTKTYSQWIEAAKLEMIVSHRGMRPLELGAENSLCMDLFCGFGFNRDVSNVIKPIEDLLKRCGMVKDDAYVHRVSAERAIEPLMHPEYGPMVPDPGQVLMCLTWHVDKKEQTKAR